MDTAVSAEVLIGTVSRGLLKRYPFPATIAARYQVFDAGRPVVEYGEMKEFTSFQLLDNRVSASPTMELATCGSFKPLPAELAL